MKKQTVLEIPNVADYKPYPIKDDGYISLIAIIQDGRSIVKKYRGKLTAKELPKYLTNEFYKCTIHVECIYHYKYETTEIINKSFKVS